MKRCLLTAVVVVSVFGLVASASAGQKNRNRDQNNSNNGNVQKYAQNLGLNLQSGGGIGRQLARGNFNGISNIVSNFKKKGHKHDDEPKPLDPGRPDDRVPVEPVTPQARPGYVWVGDHWERERAPKTPTMIVDPIPGSGGVVVRDHRSISEPVVRDHRTTSGPIVRDHRNGAPQGGVSVTTTPGSSRDNAITGSGPNPLELAVDGLAKLGNVFGIGYGQVTSGDPGSRDHRTTVSTQPNARDHR